MNALITKAEPSLFEDWTKAREHLLPALVRANGTHTENDIIAGIIAGHYRLWVGKKCAVLTEFVTYPRLKELHCFLAGGDMDEILAMESSLIAWGKSQGCTRAKFSGRKGWEKILTDYSFGSLTLFKDI